jgi:ketosteroid isomerase-like protein
MESTLSRLLGAISLVVQFCLIVTLLSSFAAGLPDPPPTSCATPSYRSFDFWLGDWEVSNIGSPAKVANARITALLRGCVIREEYEGVDGHAGQSLTTFDTTRNVWHQTWMTNTGTLLQIEGEFENGQMVLSGKNQQGEIVRGTWKPVDGEVRETAVKSADGGKTWEPWFDILFRRESGSGGNRKPGNTEDQNTVAALDAQYQEAVKNNDAATMDKILADDFTLVTSSGKVYTKAQLLDEAKQGRTTYEHQEDTEKSVRVWGDTAIVTAFLWEKGTESGKPFDHKLWFSDVYRRTPIGWRYAFAQSAYRNCELNP